MSAAKTTILVVEDNPPLARIYQEYLEAEGYAVSLVGLGAEVQAAVDRDRPAVIVLDLKLPDMDGLEVLKHLHATVPEIPVVVATAHGSISVAVDAMREGAFDFLVKPFTSARLAVTVRNAREKSVLASMVERYRRELDRDGFYEFVGASTEMQAVYHMIEAVAGSRASVFLTGESGTGKELAADAIHRASPRRGKPLVVINCAAIPKDLLESEIFGHVRGAFTGATMDRVGAAQQADGGTLFLDEICEMPVDLQAKLLRFVQTGLVQPVGSSRQDKVDVRFIAATNRDPLAEVQAGRFREDLYYRLHVVPIHMPALRDREDDAVLIARRFLAQMSSEEGKGFQAFAPDVEARIRAFDWPGNVRQLQNIVRNIVVLHDGAEVTLAMLPDPLKAAMPARPTLAVAGQVGDAPAPAAAPGGIRPLWLVEKETIQHALSLTDNDVPRAAALLEISPSTIYRKLQQWKSGEGA